MPIHNNDIAEIFERIADILELKGENAFRIRAYRNAARTVSGLSQSIADMVETHKNLSELPGIGNDLARKIEEYVTTGKMRFFEELKDSIPSELSYLMDISGLGPGRVRQIYEKLGIKTLDDLALAAKENKIQRLAGFGVKTEQSILEGIQQIKQGKKRLRLPVAEQIAFPLVEYLRKSTGTHSIEIAGSFRRRLETVGDLDILASCDTSTDIIDRFIKYEDVRKVVARGATRTSVLLRSGLQVDLRVVQDESYGAALHYFTGSKEHNIAVRKIGMRRNLKINEYGVYRGDVFIGGKTEKEVYDSVGLPYIDPELRENRGEIEAAQKGRLPRLITADDIKGDLHVHTSLTDGRNTLMEMAEAAKRRGYQYIANTEHSKRLTVAKGLDVKGLAEQIEAIDLANKDLHGFVILKGIEVDILEDGSLDLPDEILKELDVVVGAIHSHFGLSQAKQTQRVLRAIQDARMNILAHPTGRMINERNPYQIDMEAVMKAAKKNRCVMELNAQPMRLDLNDLHCKMAKDIGVRIALSTDSHSVEGYEALHYGISQARRGWLEPVDVINTRGLEDLLKLLKR
jgi:DNA polymerase (family X)